MILRPWALLAALAAAGGLLALTASMRRTQAAQAVAYEAAAAHQRKAAGATRAVEPDRPLSTAPGGCVTGAEAFAGAASRGIVAFPAGARLAALIAVSDAAVRSEHEAELLRPAPTLPQRVGVMDGAQVDPPRLACGGKGWAEAYVVGVTTPSAKATAKRRK
ncbi:MAG TPA: hypothetical protein VKE22_10050 [Haliangiales bacterium]|nr:hypothetical protein [Haliangiales bacterium]